MASDDGGLRALFRERIREFHWQSIETGGTGLGVPDSNFCYATVDAWIEFKQTEGYDVKLRPEQIGWLSRRSRVGGRVFVAVRRWHDGGPRKGAPVDDLWILAGGESVEIRKQGLREEQSYVLGIFRDGPSRWDWNQIRRILLCQRQDR